MKAFLCGKGEKREREDDTQRTQSRLLLTKLGNLLDLPKAIPPNGSYSDSDSHIVRVVILKKNFLNRLTAASSTALASFFDHRESHDVIKIGFRLL